jgi:hypothetical protein
MINRLTRKAVNGKTGAHSRSKENMSGVFLLIFVAKTWQKFGSLAEI